jgi:predicted LPLAT superfamily acyltransferase
MRIATTDLSNPGPPWGYAFLSWAERSWPRWIFRPSLMLGSWIGLARMRVARMHSRAFLSVVLGRSPRLVEQWRHFFAYTEVLMLKFRAGRGAVLRCSLEAEHADGFEALVGSGRPALFGSFHFGASDLLGYLLGERGRRVSMLRLRMGNSDDTRLLGQRFARNVSILWVNDPANVLFSLKAAIEAGESIALTCDRFEYSAKVEPFDFLGTRRLFPFTIYHLALLFDRPVVFCLAVAGSAPDELRVYASPVFAPDAALDRAANLAAARLHFQGVVTQLEILVRRYPALWFNYLPLNPEAPAQGSAAAVAA